MRAGKGSFPMPTWPIGNAALIREACSDDIQAEVAAGKAARLEARYTDEDLERLIRSKGLDASAGTSGGSSESAGA